MNDDVFYLDGRGRLWLQQALLGATRLVLVGEGWNDMPIRPRRRKVEDDGFRRKCTAVTLWGPPIQTSKPYTTGGRALRAKLTVAQLPDDPYHLRLTVSEPLADDPKSMRVAGILIDAPTFDAMKQLFEGYSYLSTDRIERPRDPVEEAEEEERDAPPEPEKAPLTPMGEQMLAEARELQKVSAFLGNAKQAIEEAGAPRDASEPDGSPLGTRYSLPPDEPNAPPARVALPPGRRLYAQGDDPL